MQRHDATVRENFAEVDPGPTSKPIFYISFLFTPQRLRCCQKSSVGTETLISRIMKVLIIAKNATNRIR